MIEFYNLQQSKATEGKNKAVYEGLRNCLELPAYVEPKPAATVTSTNAEVVQADSKKPESKASADTNPHTGEKKTEATTHVEGEHHKEQEVDADPKNEAPVS